MSAKKLVILGLAVYFADSFRYFQKKGFQVTVLKHEAVTRAFADNEDLYKDLGFKVVNYRLSQFPAADFAFERLELDGETLVLGGPNFEGDIASLNEELEGSSFYDLWLFQALAAYNRERSLGAMLVRFHNGDTGFGSREMADLYSLALAEADLLLFDNDLLRDFVFFNAPALKDKRSRLIWLEGPLKDQVCPNSGREIEFLSLGRVLNEHKLNLPVLSLPSRKKSVERRRPVKWRYCLAQAKSLDRLEEDRRAFSRDLAGTVFGLSHLGGVFGGSTAMFEGHRDFFFPLRAKNWLFPWPRPKNCTMVSAIAPVKI